ncbi:D-alanyl-D-alanine carboxypeptidase family protein [Frigoribacterium salinisoli]
MTGDPRARRARRLTVAGLVALVLVAVGTYVPVALLVPVAPTAPSVVELAPRAVDAPELALPGYGAAAVEALDVPGTRTLAGDRGRRSIASISKVVTALVVLDERPLDGGAGPRVTFSDDDEALRERYLAVDGKVAPLAAGTALSQRQVMEVMLVESANNYATALARWAFGDDAAFVEAAGAWLAEHDLDDTTIVEPTGLSPDNRSTTADLLELARIALDDPDVAEIVRTTSLEVPGVGTVENSNGLLGVDGVVGIKTGTLDAAGACLLFAADQVVDGGATTVVGVVLGAADHPSLDRDVRALLASVSARTVTVTPVRAGDVLATYEAPWGARASAVAAEDATATVWGDADARAEAEVEPVREGTAGDVVGDVVVEVGDERVAVPARLDGDLPGPDGWWRLTHPDRLF